MLAPCTIVLSTSNNAAAVGSSATVAGLTLTAERMAGRRHRVASVVVRRAEPDPSDDVHSETEAAHG